jgi:hypothetical protein
MENKPAMTKDGKPVLDATGKPITVRALKPMMVEGVQTSTMDVPQQSSVDVQQRGMKLQEDTSTPEYKAEVAKQTKQAESGLTGEENRARDAEKVLKLQHTQAQYKIGMDVIDSGALWRLNISPTIKLAELFDKYIGKDPAIARLKNSINHYNENRPEGAPAIDMQSGLDSVKALLKDASDLYGKQEKQLTERVKTGKVDAGLDSNTPTPDKGGETKTQPKYSGTDKTVTIKGPDGKAHIIEEKQLPLALKQGYKLVSK